MVNQRTIVLIANPNAGRGSAQARAREIARFCKLLKRRGMKVEVQLTAAPQDATRLTAQAVRDGANDIIVAGGDGTINEALQSLIDTRARLAVWPRGTANVLARELRLPFDTEAAAEVIARGRTQTIYAGCATSELDGDANTGDETRRYFLLMAGIGLDASVVRGVQPRLKRRVGEVAFWYSGLEHLALWQPAPFEVEIDGEIFEATFAAIGKAAHYGGGLAITPRAEMTQADFEICLVESRSRFRYLYLLAHTLRTQGVPPSMSGVRFLRSTIVRARGRALVQADGELIGTLPMRFEIVPRAIEIIVP